MSIKTRMPISVLYPHHSPVQLFIKTSYETIKFKDFPFICKVLYDLFSSKIHEVILYYSHLHSLWSSHTSIVLLFELMKDLSLALYFCLVCINTLPLYISNGTKPWSLFFISQLRKIFRSSQLRDRTQASHIEGRVLPSEILGKPKNTGVGSLSPLKSTSKRPFLTTKSKDTKNFLPMFSSRGFMVSSTTLRS